VCYVVAAFGLAMDINVPGKIVKAVKLGYETAKIGKKVITSGQEIKVLIKIEEHSNSGVKKLTDSEIEKIAKESTHNPNSNMVILGKFEGNNVKTSYQEIAKREGATYFEIDDALNLLSLDKAKINQVFLRQQSSIPNKRIFTTHSPLNQTGGFGIELQLLKNEKSIFEYRKTNDLWEAFQ
jgi:hypothetical protein